VGFRLLFDQTDDLFMPWNCRKAKLFTVKWLEDSITGKTDPIGDL
jgi:hypothetical protein